MPHTLFDPGETRSLLRFDLDFLPAGAVVQSATFGIHLRLRGSGEQVGLYRITQEWGEDEPSWDSHAEQYDASTEWGGFAVAGYGWLTSDVTGLVTGWAEGTYANYGLMMINVSGQALDEYHSSEYATASYRPWLEVCYMVP